MKKRAYQPNYSDLEPKMYDFHGRKKRALKILAIIEDFLKSYSSKKTKNLVCLDVGCSLGIITRTLAPNFKKIIGIDIDKSGIKIASKKYAYPNLTFKLDDVLNLSFKDNYFDVIICNNVYEHVPDPFKMMNEIYRVLKKGGICYFAATNKYMIIESDHKLPFLSWLPVFLASFYLRITGKGKYYYERPFSYGQLKKLLSGFKTYDYTMRVIKEPKIFKANYRMSRIASRIPLIFIKPFMFFFPQFFWILVKEE